MKTKVTAVKKEPCDCNPIHLHTIEKVNTQMPDINKFISLAELYKVFADSTRVRILWALDCNEMCVCDLASLLNMTKSAISHQLKVLRLVNLIKYRRQGKVIFYSLADDHVKEILSKGWEHINE